MQRLLSTQQPERRRHRRRVCGDESVTSMSEPEKGNSEHRKHPRYSGPNLPEDIWCHVHSLLPLRDAAHAACVSHMFLSSWRCYPNLIFTKKTLSLKRNARGEDIERAFTCIIDQILKKHSGNGLKTLELDISHCRNLNAYYLKNWLQIAITPRVENLIIKLPLQYEEGYKFTGSLLFGGNSIQHLHLTSCAFRPMFGAGCFRSLTKFYLFEVRITGEELGYLLSNALALEQFELGGCSEIICLKIPCVLQRLSFVTVSTWKMLQMIESKAPNLSTFNFVFFSDLVQLSLGSSQVKNLSMECIDDCNLLCYAITKLPYITPNVETLHLSSLSEMVTTPMAAAKFLHLKHLEIYLDGDISEGYDYFSLISFLDASPILKTFIIGVDQNDMAFDSVFGNASDLRQVLEHKHDSLKNVTILGFCSAKSMVELTCHILENSTSLECITLDSVLDRNDTDNVGRCSLTSARKTGDCSYLSDEKILEAYNALEAIQRYIVGKVPSSVKLDVRGPCCRCHTLER